MRNVRKPEAQARVWAAATYIDKWALKRRQADKSGTFMLVSNPSLALQAAITFLLFSSSASLQAQSCAMCKTTAQALSSVWALNLGIILLLIPPLGIMPAFLYLAFKGRSQGDSKSK